MKQRCEANPSLETLGNLIRERRQQLGLTQEALGRRLGWQQERISLLEHGKYGLPSIVSLARLAEALDMPRAMLVVAVWSANGADLDAAEICRQTALLNRRSAELSARLARTQEHIRQLEREMAIADSLRCSVRERREQLALALGALQCPGSPSRAASAD